MPAAPTCCPVLRRKIGQYWTRKVVIDPISRSSLATTFSFEKGPPTNRVTFTSPQIARARGRSALPHCLNPRRSVFMKYLFSLVKAKLAALIFLFQEQRRRGSALDQLIFLRRATRGPQPGNIAFHLRFVAQVLHCFAQNSCGNFI